MSDKPKIGATALLIRSKPDNPLIQQVLAIKCAKGRGLILPGGKFEWGVDKTYEETAARELFEETRVRPLDRGKWVFGNINTDGYYVNTFRFDIWDDRGAIVLPDGSFAGLDWEEGRPQWVPIGEFLTSHSQFMPYYDLLFNIGSLRFLYENY